MGYLQILLLSHRHLRGVTPTATATAAVSSRSSSTLPPLPHRPAQFHPKIKSATTTTTFPSPFPSSPADLDPVVHTRRRSAAALAPPFSRVVFGSLRCRRPPGRRRDCWGSVRGVLPERERAEAENLIGNVVRGVCGCPVFSSLSRDGCSQCRFGCCSDGGVQLGGASILLGAQHCNRRWHSDLSSPPSTPPPSSSSPSHLMGATRVSSAGWSGDKAETQSILADLLRRLDAPHAASGAPHVTSTSADVSASLLPRSVLSNSPAARTSTKSEATVTTTAAAAATYVPLLFRSDFVHAAGHRNGAMLQQQHQHFISSTRSSENELEQRGVASDMCAAAQQRDEDHQRADVAGAVASREDAIDFSAEKAIDKGGGELHGEDGASVSAAAVEAVEQLVLDSEGSPHAHEEKEEENYHQDRDADAEGSDDVNVSSDPSPLAITAAEDTDGRHAHQYSAAASPPVRTSRRLILDPIEWLSQMPDAPLMDPDLLHTNTNVRDALQEAVTAAAAAHATADATGANTIDSGGGTAPASLSAALQHFDEDGLLTTTTTSHSAATAAAGAVDMGEDDDESIEAATAALVHTSDDNEAALLTDLLDDVPPTRTSTKNKAARHSASTAASVAPSEEADVLVYNVFTRRVAKASSPSVRLLSLLGIGVDAASRELRLNDPAALHHLATELRARRVSWPSLWSRGPLFRQLERILCDEGVTDTEKRVSGLLQVQYRASRWQHQLPGVVVGDAVTDGEEHGDAQTQQQQQQQQQMAESVDDKLLTLQDLNEEQQAVVELVMKGHHTYIGGGAGTGKSVLLRVLKQQLIKEGLAVAVTGTTGIAGAQIGGCTLHHCLGINVSGEFTRRKELSSYDVLIIDEVSMLSRDLFEALELQLRRANSVHLPFGGVQVILCGDFLQLGAIDARLLITSPLFRRYFVHLKLRTVVRQNANPHFASQLLQLRRGSVPRDLGDTVHLTATPTERQQQQQQQQLHERENALRERQRQQLQALCPSVDAERPPELTTTDHNRSEDDDRKDGVSAAAAATGQSALPSFVSGAVNLLPTNKEVHATNTYQLQQLPGELVTFAPQFLPPSLVGSWSPTYLLRVEKPDSAQRTAVWKEVTRYLAAFYTAGQRASASAVSAAAMPDRQPSTSSPAAAVFSNGEWLLDDGHRERSVVLYPLFTDALALRVRLPLTMDREEARHFLLYLGELDKHLAQAHPSLGVRVRDVVAHGDGMHTEQDEYTLAQYAGRATLAHTLELKIGARVMLRTNFGPGLVNGSLGTVVGFRRLSLDELPRYLVGNAQREEAVVHYKDFLQYEQGFETPMVPVVDFQGRQVPIPPITQYVGGLANTHFYSVGVVALPLSLAYAFTVHKVQGLTLVGRVHLELSRMWPCEHLLYVAMSRVRNPEQMSISSFHPRLVRVATDCLLFDDSLPPVSAVTIAPYMIAATWRRAPSRRKKALLRRQLEDYVKRRRSKLMAEAKKGNMQAEIQLIEEAMLKRRARSAAATAASAAAAQVEEKCAISPK